MQKLWIVPTLSFLCACGAPTFTEDMVLGGEKVSAATLNLGHELYTENCYACHGENGDGHGPASAYLRPQPRDFRTGVFKFAWVENPGLPHTEDLIALVRRGLSGTAMLTWDVPAGEHGNSQSMSDSQLAAILNYIKTFSSTRVPESSQRWSKEKTLGRRIVPDDAHKDPFGAARVADAVAMGRMVYHVKAQCAKCHPAYVTQQEFWDLTRNGNEWAYGELLYRSQLRKSDEFKGMKILPIDFIYHSIKTVNAADSDESMRYFLYRTIGSGVQGAAMPTWEGNLSNEELWSLVYYIQSLHAQKDTPEGMALRQKLTNQTPFVPPADGATPAPEPAP